MELNELLLQKLEGKSSKELFALKEKIDELKMREKENMGTKFVPNVKSEDFIRNVGRNEAFINLFCAANGVGKMHPYSTVIPTPQGERKWGDLKVGDKVFGADGKPTKIVGTKHFQDVPMYRVTFDDKSFCDVSSGHLWNVKGWVGNKHRGKRGDWVTMETIDIVKHGVTRKNGRVRARQWQIPVQGPAEFESQETGLHPYLMGIWLSDGHRKKSVYTKAFPSHDR